MSYIGESGVRYKGRTRSVVSRKAGVRGELIKHALQIQRERQQSESSTIRQRRKDARIIQMLRERRTAKERTTFWPREWIWALEQSGFPEAKISALLRA